MKLKILLVLLLATLGLHAQIDTLYFDSEWLKCSYDSAAYYRVLQTDSLGKPVGLTRDYYITGEIQWEGTYTHLDPLDESKNRHHGLCTWYYKDGNKWQERVYVNDTIDGMMSSWHKNGNIAEQIKYKMGKYDGIWADYYPSGKLSRLFMFSDGYSSSPFYTKCDQDGDCKKIFIEDFYSDNNYNWWPLEKDNPNRTMQIVAEKGLMVINREKTNYLQAIDLALDENEDFTIEAEIELLKGKSHKHGLAWGCKDLNNYHYFLINGKGEFAVGTVAEGINVPYKKWTKSKYLKKNRATNKISIMCKGNSLVWALNGETVFRDTKKGTWGHGYGFYGQNNGGVLYKNLIIQQDAGKNNDLDRITSEHDITRWKGTGSAFFINTNGLLATNYHVVDDSKEITIEFIFEGQKKEYKATVVKMDKQSDLAILQVTDANFTPLRHIPYSFTDATASVGKDVFTLGYPMAMNIMGEEVKFTNGKISSKTGFQNDIKTYQISVPLQPGNSGSPLFDYEGNLVGVNSSKLSAFVAENVSYAVKTSYLKNLIEILPNESKIPSNNTLKGNSLTDIIKILSEYVVLVKVK